MIVSAEECDGIVINNVGDDYVTVKSSTTQFLYSWGFKIRAEITVNYDEEVGLEFTASRRVPVNVTSNPKKYKFQWISTLISEGDSEIDLPEIYDVGSSESSGETNRGFFSRSKFESLSGAAGSRAKLIIKHALDEVIDDNEIEVNFDEQNTYIRFTGDGLEELKTEMEDVFGSEDIAIRYSDGGGFEIKINE